MGGVVSPELKIVSARDKGSSPVSQETGVVGVDAQSFFAWRAPQNWDWLLNAAQDLNQ